jgi:hypothetical protein
MTETTPKIVRRGLQLADFLNNGKVSGDMLQSRAAQTVRDLVTEIQLYRYVIAEMQTCNNMAEVREMLANTLAERS